MADVSSTTSSPTGFFASPRRQRWLMWISGAVLVIGIAVFLGVILSRGGSSGPASHEVAKVGSPPSSSTKPAANDSTVAPSTDALKVARTFLETAVLRKNLAASYALVGPDLKGGMSLAQWRKGNIPVQPFPAINAKTAKFVVLTSTKSELRLAVGPLVARKGSGVRPLAFYLNVDRIGGKWLVNYYLPDYHPGSRANPNY